MEPASKNTLSMLHQEERLVRGAPKHTLSESLIRGSDKIRLYVISYESHYFKDCIIGKIPADVLKSIFSYLNVQSLLRAQRVCKHWYNQGTEESIWSKINLSLVRTQIEMDPEKRMQAYTKARISVIAVDFAIRFPRPNRDQDIEEFTINELYRLRAELINSLMRHS